MDLFDIIYMGFVDFLSWYSQEALNGVNLIEFFSKQFMIYILLQIVMYFLPFIRKFLNVICLPFRWIHVYLHVYEAKLIIEELQKQRESGEEDDSGFDLDSGQIRSSLISGLDVSDENPGLLMAFNQLKHAQRVALAPNKFAIFMLISYIILAPLAFATGEVFTTQIGSLVHLYFFLGIFGIMMPSMNDWYFIFHSFLISSLNIRPIWIYFSLIVYICFTIELFWRTGNLFIAIFVSTFIFLFYLFGIVISHYLAVSGKLGSKLKDTKIFFIPYTSQKNFSTEETDIEFLALEDLEI
ncbi:MAG: hypothetical protein EAX86_05750 [Candidatus Heimdallarchaeota archaeon]|nr:hypothetical protein [Candidatus Heimdallarchaeota archaeon]